MLSPEYLDAAPDALVELLRQLEDDILRDAARRIGKTEKITDTAQWQLWRLEQLEGLREDVVRRLSQYSGKTDDELRRIFQESGTAALSEDDAVYQAAGKSPPPANASPALVNLLNAGYRQTRGTWQNLTATTANTVAGQFEAALDRAWFQVSSGAFDYRTAIKQAVDGLSRDMTYVTYPSGHRDTLEVAARRAVLTGVNQTAGKLQLQRMEDMDCSFVETTAHPGARPEHALWQGRVFHRGGAVTVDGVEYPDFVSTTGYGTGPGLCGWNCRHSFFPFFPGLSERAYSEEKLREYSARDMEYNGKLYTRYELSQIQRGLERKVRKWKRQYLAEDAAGVDTTEASVRLRTAREQLRQFARQTGLDLDSNRIGVSGFGRSQASRATAGAVQYYRDWLKSIGAESTELDTLAKYYDGKYNNTPAYQLLMGYNRAVEKKNISPLVGFEVYQQIDSEIRHRLVGAVTSTGVEIKSYTPHFIERIIGQTSTPHSGMRQGVSVADALDAIQNPIRIGSPWMTEDGDTRQTFYGESAVVSVSLTDQRLIQTNPS